MHLAEVWQLCRGGYTLTVETGRAIFSANASVLVFQCRDIRLGFLRGRTHLLRYGACIIGLTHRIEGVSCVFREGNVHIAAVDIKACNTPMTTLNPVNMSFVFVEF